MVGRGTPVIWSGYAPLGVDATRTARPRHVHLRVQAEAAGEAEARHLQAQAQLQAEGVTDDQQEDAHDPLRRAQGTKECGARGPYAVPLQLTLLGGDRSDATRIPC